MMGSDGYPAPRRGGRRRPRPHPRARPLPPVPIAGVRARPGSTATTTPRRRSACSARSSGPSTPIGSCQSARRGFREEGPRRSAGAAAQQRHLDRRLTRRPQGHKSSRASSRRRPENPPFFGDCGRGDLGVDLRAPVTNRLGQISATTRRPRSAPVRSGSGRATPSARVRRGDGSGGSTAWWVPRLRAPRSRSSRCRGRARCGRSSR